MKVFVSSARTNREKARELMTYFEERGAEITYDWTQLESPNARYLDSEMEALAARLRHGVSICELYVLLLPGGINSHSEFGLALAWRKEVWVVTRGEFSKSEDDPAACAFYFDPHVKRVYWPIPNSVQSDTGCEQGGGEING